MDQDQRPPVPLAEGVASLRLSRPQRLNAFDAADLDALLATVAELRAGAADGTVRAAVVSGAGRAFCAGADLAFIDHLLTAAPGPRAAGLGLARRLTQELIRLPVPTVAAVQGPAYGGGACLALACDHVVAAEEARIGLVFTALGLPGGDMCAPWLLARRVGTRRAWRLLADAAEVTAADALALGLVDEVVPATEVQERAAAVAGRWAATGAFGLQATKAQVLALEGADDALLTTSDREAATMVEAFARPDVAAAVAAARRR